MTTVERLKRLKSELDLSSRLTEELMVDVVDIIGDKCRSCSKQRDCWGPTKFYWLTPVSLKSGEEWDCANYTPLSCASVIGRPFTIRVGKGK